MAVLRVPCSILWFQMAKSHLGNGNSCGKTKVSAFCIQLLVDLYMAATPKSPFKCAIARFVFQLMDFLCCFCFLY